jgi:hypothetical protein
VPGRSRSPPISVVDSGSPEPMLNLSPTSSPLANKRQRRRLRLPQAAANQDFCSPSQPEIGEESRKVREVPASADVAQLVEHFTRNEGVPGSSPGVGSDGLPA